MGNTTDGIEQRAEKTRMFSNQIAHTTPRESPPCGCVTTNSILLV